MVKNLLETGTCFSYKANDKNFSDNLLDLDIIDGIEIKENSEDTDFEDEDED